MNILGRVLFTVFATVVAAAAYIHATSEVRLSPLSSTLLLRVGLTTEAMGLAVDRIFKLQMGENAAQGLAEFEPLADPGAELARRTFAADPLNAATIRTIALGSVLHEDANRARELMQLAARISKRDSLTNLWLAQNYGTRGEMDAMMASFDHALRTSSRTREAAIGPMVNLLADSESHGPLGALLDRRPEWEGDFWANFVNNPVALQNAPEFFTTNSLSLDRLKPTARERLYANLKNAREFDVLRRLATLDPGTAAGVENLATGRFETTEQGNPMGWILHSQGNFAARVLPSTGELLIDAQAGSFGVAAERVFPIAQAYALEVRMAEPLPENARLDLTATCAMSGGDTLGRVVLGPGERGGQTELAGRDCDFGDLQLSFSVDPGRRDAFIQVAGILLRPI